MSDRFLEQEININFCVKLGNNASDTCSMLSEAYGGEAMKKSSAFKSTNGLKRVIRQWKMMKEENLTEPMKMLKK
jgi:hypothetical protein